MRKLSIRFGLMAGAILSGLNLITDAILGSGPETFKISEVIGYSSIALSMSLIYFAIRSYRDELADGAITFGRALGVGLITDLVASALYGVFMIVYFSTLKPEFLATYMEYYKDQIRSSGLPAEEITTQLSQFEASRDLYLNPYFQSLVMFATVFMIGVVISLIAAVLLKRRVGARDA